MSIIKNIIRSTDLYKNYQKKKAAKYRLQQEAVELALLPQRKQFYAQFIANGQTVFDVGANMGNRVQVFLAIGAKVVAVEPQPSCIQILTTKFGDSILLEQVGLSNEAGVLEMHIANDSTISSFSKDFIDTTSQTRFSHYNWDTTIKVPVTTLDALINKHGIPQFCKIDVEGFELNVLKGLNHAIPFISFEYCVPEMLDAMIDCMKELHRISPNGTFNYSIAETMKLELTEWVSLEEMRKIAKTPYFQNTLFGDIYFRSGD